MFLNVSFAEFLTGRWDITFLFHLTYHAFNLAAFLLGIPRGWTMPSENAVCWEQFRQLFKAPWHRALTTHVKTARWR